MPRTYTYTARSANNPDRVVTLTLYDHRLSLQLGIPLQLSKEEESEQAEQELKLREEARQWLKPMALWLLDRRLHPFDVGDVSASSTEKGFLLAAWIRVAGLRLVPLVVALPEVDNPEGAQAFVDELESRKATQEVGKGLWGPFDYWGAWVGAALLLWGLSRRKEQ